MDEQSKKPLKKSNETAKNDKKDGFTRFLELQGEELKEEMEILDNLIRASKDMQRRKENNERIDGYII